MSALLAPLAVELVQLDRRYPEVQADRLEDVVAFAADRLASEVEPPWLIDDSGLFIDALDGFPGVYSSHAHRTIGPSGILRLLRGAATRAARFETALVFHDGTAGRVFRGTCAGAIARSERGTGGFGFDPIFMPLEHRRTFAEMSVDEKNRLSHRGHAARALGAYVRRRGWTEGGGHRP